MALFAIMANIEVVNMSMLRDLTVLMADAVRHGHDGFFTTHELSLLLGRDTNSSIRKYLHKAVKEGVLKKVARDLYCSEVAGFSDTLSGTLERIATKLYPSHFMYVSLESELSRLGVISQIPIKHLTVMTVGPANRVSTPFGDIEFTHTAKTGDKLTRGVYYDDVAHIYRADEARAISDLKRVGRNLHMLNDDE